MTNYDKFNREERAICAHLFRLLHEFLDKGNNSPLGRLINILLERKIISDNSFESSNHLDFSNVSIFTEVAIIRDYFYVNKTNPTVYMDKLVALIMAQEKISDDCRLYSELGDPLNNPKKTHPKQIRQKALDSNINLTRNELRVYGSLQGMFNAKPDLVLAVDNKLIVIEAKFTEKFDDEQLVRTRKITQVWKELLYQEFGFKQKPDSAIVKLGASKFNADINWNDICKIARLVYPPKDRSMIAFETGLKLLQDLDYE